jgi:hypothetical protein
MSVTRIAKPGLSSQAALDIGFALCWLAIFYVLPPPAPIEPGIDPSWQAYLAEMFLRHAQFGRDIIFTYGPWGFLGEPRGNPAIYPWLLLGRSVLAISTAVSLAYLGNEHIQSRLYRWLWLLAILVLANPIVLAPFLLFAVLSETADTPLRRLSLLTLIPSCALAANVKFTVLFLLIPLAILILIDEVFIRRRFPFVTCALGVCYLAWYLAAHQSLSAFPEYLSNAGAITSGYTPGLHFGPTPVVHLLVGAALFLIPAVIYFSAVFPAQRWKIIYAAWVTLFFFVGFKHTFVRYDESHVWMGVMNHTLPAILILAVLTHRYKVLIATASIGLLLFGAAIARTPWMREKTQSTQSDISRLQLSFAGADARRQQYEKELLALRAEHPLKHLDGTVDLLPYDTYLLLAHPFEVRARPIFQSYSVYTPKLIHLNADFFTSPEAPAHVFLDPDTMDRRFNSLNDNLAWLSLLSNYEPEGFSGTYLILRKATVPMPVTKEPVLEKTISWNEELRLPDLPGALLWAEIEIQPTLIGRLMTTFYRPGAVTIFASPISHEAPVLVPGIAQTGFLLSPFVKDAPSFAALYSGAPDAAPVSAISLRTSGMGKYTFSPNVSVRIFRLNVPHREVNTVKP